MRKYVIYCLVALLLIGLVPVGVSAAENDGIYEIVIYPNKKGMQTLDSEENLVLGDIEVTYDVNYENNEIDIYFEEPIFVSDVISEGSTIHKTIKVNDFDEIEVNEELKTDGFMFASVNKLKMKYEDINSVEYIKIQSGNEPDFSGGLLDNTSYEFYSNGTTSIDGRLTDNDLSTFIYFNPTGDYKVYFKNFGVFKVDKFRIFLNSYHRYGNIFYNFFRNGESVKSFAVRGATHSSGLYEKTFEPFECDLIEIDFRISSGSGSACEFNVYGELLEYPDTEPPAEVNNLCYTLNGQNVNLSWVNPNNEDFAGVNIYRDDVLIVKNYVGESYIDEGLEVGIYEYKVTTVDNVNNESEGVKITVTIEEPLEEVTNLDYTVEDDKVTLTWTNPTSENFEGVNIYRDGKLIKTTIDESFSENLPSGIYEYRITTTEAGRESPGIIINVLVQSAPTPVKNVRITNMTSTGGLVTWTENPTYENVEKYIIYVNGEKHGEIEAPPYPLQGLEEGKTYTISVQAINSYGTSEPPTAITYTPTKLSEIKDTIKINDIFSYLSMLFKNMWPLLALVLAIILSPKIYNLIKSNVT